LTSPSMDPRTSICKGKEGKSRTEKGLWEGGPEGGGGAVSCGGNKSQKGKREGEICKKNRCAGNREEGKRRSKPVAAQGEKKRQLELKLHEVKKKNREQASGGRLRRT